MRKSILGVISFLIFASFQSKKEEEIIVLYSAISCSCAQWQIVNSNSKENIYLERSNTKIVDADKIWNGKTLPLKIKVFGNFKEEIGLPAEMKFKGDPKPARVFKYDKIEVIQYGPKN
ncbi:hypothetical protein ACFSJW_06235 [Flavobacterium artemisiae]|uniref:Uncharacterized protein n=1 Tax=Flavobacterium artemisiae TaxID=2126556 RepID=A0ABW4HCE1_9FLAO